MAEFVVGAIVKPSRITDALEALRERRPEREFTNRAGTIDVLAIRRRIVVAGLREVLGALNLTRSEFFGIVAEAAPEWISDDVRVPFRSAADPEHEPKSEPRKAICDACGDEYESTRSHQKYCSKRCGQAHFKRLRRDQNRQMRSCSVCQTKFEAKTVKQQYCSSNCGSRAFRQRTKERSPVTLNCRQCQATFTVSAMHRGYCSRDCQKRAARKRQNETRRNYG